MFFIYISIVFNALNKNDMRCIFFEALAKLYLYKSNLVKYPTKKMRTLHAKIHFGVSVERVN